jgi:type IV pilus assembly protein PilB
MNEGGSRPRTGPGPAKTRVTLPELLLNENMVSLDQCLEAMRHQRENGGTMAAAFVRSGFVEEEAIASLLSRTYDVPSIRLERFAVDPAIVGILPVETARRCRVLPLAASTTLTIAVADPGDRLAIDAIGNLTGWTIQPVVAFDSALADAIDRYYRPARSRDGVAPSRERGLRLAWSREQEDRRGPEGGPGGDRPAA